MNKLWIILLILFTSASIVFGGANIQGTILAEDINISNDLNVDGSINGNITGNADTATVAITWDSEISQANLNVNNSVYLNGYNSSNFLLTSDESNLNVNHSSTSTSASRWDDLNNPSDINAGDITNDGTYILTSDESNLNVNHSLSTTTWSGLSSFTLLNYRLLLNWLNISDRPTNLSQFTNDLNINTSNVNHSNSSTYATYWDSETSQADLNVNHSVTANNATTATLAYTATTLNDGQYNLNTTGTIDATTYYGDGSQLTGTGNNSWNETYADTLYADINTISYNTSFNETYTDTLYADINTISYNTSFNETYTDTLYAPITTNPGIWDNVSGIATYDGDVNITGNLTVGSGDSVLEIEDNGTYITFTSITDIPYTFDENVSAPYFIGNGSLLTDITDLWTNESGVATYDGDVVADNFDSVGINWTTGNEIAYGNIYAATYGDGKFVAITQNTATVLVSTDGVKWTNYSSVPNTGQLTYGLTYGNGLFVAVQYGGYILTSTNGINWSIATDTGTQNWRNVIYANGKFMAVGIAYGIIGISEDGKNWDTSVSLGESNYFDLAYGNNMYVSLGLGSISKYSYDGITWLNGTIQGPSSAYGITYGNGRFVAVGISNKVWTSTNGINWTNGTGTVSGLSWLDVLYDNGKFIAVGSSGGTGYKIMTSTDGLTWTAMEHSLSTSEYKKIVSGNGIIIAMPFSNTYPLYSGKTINSVRANNNMYHGDTEFTNVVTINNLHEGPGMTFESNLPAEGNYWTEVVYGDGQFVAVAQDGTYRVMTSLDGVNWINQTAAEDNAWRGITYGNGIYVAVANSGTNRVMTSTDGVHWTARSASAANLWNRVAYGNGTFVAIPNGNSIGIKSVDGGVTWTNITLPLSTGWYDIVYGNDKFIATGGGYIIYSYDGENWVNVTDETVPAATAGITYGNGKFIIGSISGQIYASSNGINWSLADDVGINAFLGATYGDGKFVLVGNGGSGVQIATSIDGINWQLQQHASNTSQYRAAAYGNGVFVTIPYSGDDVVLTSGKQIDNTPPTNNILNGDIKVNGNINATTYYGDGSQLTGISGGASLWTNDSTTATYDYGNVSVNTDAFFVDAADKQVGIGTNNPTSGAELHIRDAGGIADLVIQSAESLTIRENSINVGGLYHGSNTIMTWDGSERVSVGAAVDTSAALYVYGIEGYSLLLGNGYDNRGLGLKSASTTTPPQIYASVNNLVLETNSAPKLNITSNSIISYTDTLQLTANSTAVTCDATSAGSIYYDGSTFTHYGCNSTEWRALY